MRAGRGQLVLFVRKALTSWFKGGSICSARSLRTVAWPVGGSRLLSADPCWREAPWGTGVGWGLLEELLGKFFFFLFSPCRFPKATLERQPQGDMVEGRGQEEREQQ